MAGGEPERWHINRLLEEPGRAADFQVLCVPGGFSYGDDIAAGRILGNQMQHHLAASWLENFELARKIDFGGLQRVSNPAENEAVGRAG